MTALSFGCTLSASTAASAKNGRKVSLTPSRASKSALARSRSRAIAVTSASTTVVSCAEVCSDSTIRCAITWRGRDIFWVVPRSEDGTTAAAPGRGRRGGHRPGGGGREHAGRRGPGGAPAGSPAAAGLRAWAAPGRRACARAASSTSCLRIRPPTPVPLTVLQVDRVLGGELAHQRRDVRRVAGRRQRRGRRVSPSACAAGAGLGQRGACAAGRATAARAAGRRRLAAACAGPPGRS